MPAWAAAGLITVLVRGAAAAEPTASPAAEEAPQAPARWLRVGLEAWSTTGSGEWQTVFRGTDPELGPAAGRSHLDWDDLDSLLTVLDMEARLGRLFKATVRYGSGSIEGGSGTDSDLVMAPALGADELLLLQSVSSVDGDTEFLEANLHFIVSSLLEWERVPVELDLFFGYQHYRDDLGIRNGVQTVVVGTPVLARIPGRLDSRYEFTWRGLRLGTGLKIPVNPKVAVEGRLAVLVQVAYEGEGFWNLRTDFRSAAPNFVHDADSGSGLELGLAVTARPWRRVGVRVGYDWMTWDASGGRGDSSPRTPRGLGGGAGLSL